MPPIRSFGHSRTDRAVHIVLLVVGLAISAILAEAGLRSYAALNKPFGRVYRALDPLDSQIEPHGTIGYRPKPNRTFHFGNGTTATSNAMSFRGPIVAIPKSPTIFRFVLLGGSTTHGWGVNDNETIDAYMRELLKQRYPTSRFEVVNLAFDGYDSYQLVERLRTDGRRLDPDLIIINSGINDVRNARVPDLQDPDPRTFLWDAPLAVERDLLARRRVSWLYRLKHISYLARLPGFVRMGIHSGRSVEGERGKIPANPAAAEYFGRNLGRIVALVQDRPVPIVFSSPPSALTSRYAPHATSAISYWLQDASTTEQYRLLLAERMQDVVSDLVKDGYPTRYVQHTLPARMFLDDAHLTPEGNRQLARHFVEMTEPFIIAHLRGHSLSGSSSRADLASARPQHMICDETKCAGTEKGISTTTTFSRPSDTRWR